MWVEGARDGKWDWEKMGQGGVKKKGQVGGEKMGEWSWMEGCVLSVKWVIGVLIVLLWVVVFVGVGLVEFHPTHIQVTQIHQFQSHC